MGMLDRLSYRLNILFLLVTAGLISFPNQAMAAGTNDCVLGDCKFNTQSFTAEACTPDKIGSQLQDDGVKSVHENAVKDCASQIQSTDKACQPSSNANAQQAAGQANNNTQSTNSQSNGNGTQGQCADLGNLMKAMQPPAQQYGKDCDGAQGQCKSKCGEASQKSEQACAGVKDPAKQAICKKNAATVKKCNETTSGACKKYQQQSAAVAQMLMQLASAALQMAKCQEETGVDCTKDPTNAQCPKNLDCSKSENVANPTCICQANPRAPGCPQSDANALADMAKKDKAVKDLTGGTPTTTGLDASPFAQNQRKDGGAPQGGGHAGVGAGGGAKATDAQPAGAGVKPTSADVLGGDYGGGGGGSRNAGGGYPEATNAGMNRALQNADARRLASADGKLTGKFGRSNWQKITDRYKDNRPTLLEQGR